MDELDRLRAEITDHPSNAWARERGYEPLFVAHPEARVLIISQAPGRVAQDSGIPWNDRSGDLLRSWLGVTRTEFYDPRNVAIVPMDFYYPGKAASGDVPPRRDFADRWHPPVLEQLTGVRLTVLIGSYAQRHYLGSGAPKTLTETVRVAETYLPFFPIVHPSPLARGWRTRNPWFQDTTVPLLTEHVRAALG
ncbi:uracil-DNA glycosylase family protein [Amnibacterium flavum]|uniref:Uracil-DNA glycosylase n=1 Tax=Amnibacterium flavum TaxID=2173173 RepID=A0A2V1HV09_9MICO|nr:uracil-DNA glycosylase family protein [Amnibacterium flavum]PVZ94849.1 uracil-DNA glycosylase [Amnibacterium flavum]